MADGLDDAAAGDEGESRLFVGDKVEMALAVLLLGVGEAVKFFRQRAQCLGQQAQFGAAHRQFAGLGLEQRAHRTDDVAAVPALELGVRGLAGIVIADVKLDAAGQILHRGKTGLAHDALEHHAARHLHLHRHGFQFLARLLAIKLVQLAGCVLACEVIGVGAARLAPLGELGAALGDELVFVVVEGCLFAHVCVRQLGFEGGIKERRLTVEFRRPASGSLR